MTEGGHLLELLQASASPASARRCLDLALSSIERATRGRGFAAVVRGAGEVESRASEGIEIPSAEELRAAATAGREPRRDGMRWLGTPVGDDGMAVVGWEVRGEGVDEAAAAVVLALARSATLVAARRRAAEVERLDRTARRVASQLDLGQVLTEIVRDAVELVGADSGDVVLRDAAQPVLRVVAVTGLPDDLLGFEFGAEEGASARAMSSRRPIVVSDYQQYRHRVPGLDAYRFCAVVSAPLVAGDAPIGALNVHTTDAGHRFTRDDAQVLAAFANHAAVAIDNARRYENEARLAHELAAANEELVRSLTLQQRLAEQVLLDRGVAAIVQELARLLGRPVVVQDHRLRLLAGAAANGDGWDDLPLDASMGGVGQFLRSLLADGRAASTTGRDVPGRTRVVAPILAGPDVSGYLVVPAESRLGPLDHALIEVASTGVALELAKVRARIEVEQRVRGDVVADLLTGSFSTEDAMVARAAELGIDLAVTHALLVAEPDAAAGDGAEAAGTVRRALRIVEAVLGDMAAHSVAALHGAGVVALLPARGHDGEGLSAMGIAEALSDALGRDLAPATFSIARGDDCTRPGDYAPSYRTAADALAAVRKLERTRRVVDGRALGVARLFLGSAAKEQLLAFARRTLGPVLDAPGHGQQLLVTLQAYVEAGFNQREAARRCFVHVNTAAYRLRRIESLLGVDLSDADALVDLTIALRIAQLSGLASHHNP